MSQQAKQLNERDISDLTHIAKGGQGSISRNRMIKLFKKAGATAQPVGGQLSVCYNNEAINMARGDVNYGRENTFSREVKFMAQNLCAAHNLIK
mgnify:FL=1